MRKLTPVEELTPQEKWRMIKDPDIAERIVKNWPIVCPITFEKFVYFGRDLLLFDEVKPYILPWVHWDYPDFAPYKSKHVT